MEIQEIRQGLKIWYRDIQRFDEYATNDYFELREKYRSILGEEIPHHMPEFIKKIVLCNKVVSEVEKSRDIMTLILYAQQQGQHIAATQLLLNIGVVHTDEI